MNFTDILDRFNIPYDTDGKKSRPGWINLRCPFCGRDPYLGYNLAKRYANCWQCGYHPLEGVLGLLTGLHFTKARNLVKEIPQTEWEKDLQPTGELKYPHGVGSFCSAHADYLISRGFDWYSIHSLWDVAGIGQLSYPIMRWRLFIPVSLRGEIVSWTTRTIIPDKEPRYISARREESKIPIENLVYGIDYCRNSIIVHEGPIDAWATGPGATAIMGLRCSPAQLEQISKFPVRVICFDSEPDAQMRARKLMNDLTPFPGVTHNVVLNAKDSGSASKEEIQELRQRFLDQ